MLERDDVVRFTQDKQDLQLAAEALFDEMMGRFDIAAFLAAPRDYARAFLAVGAVNAIRAVAQDAYRLGEGLAMKSKGIA